jgi:hypothetical protein
LAAASANWAKKARRSLPQENDAIPPGFLPTLDDEGTQRTEQSADIVRAECLIIDEGDARVMLLNLRPLPKQRGDRVAIVTDENSFVGRRCRKDLSVRGSAESAIEPIRECDGINAVAPEPPRKRQREVCVKEQPPRS